MSITFMFCRARATRLETKTRFAPVHLSPGEFVCSSFALRLRWTFFHVISFLFVVRSLQFALSVLASTYGQLTGPKCSVEGSLYTSKVDIQSAGMSPHESIRGFSWYLITMNCWSSFYLEIRTLSCRFTFALLYGTSYKLHAAYVTIPCQWG